MNRQTVLQAAFTCALIAPTLLRAEQTRMSDPGAAMRAAQLASAPLSAHAACFCRDSAGAQVRVGETACLIINGKSYLALCDMARSQNNTTWRRQREGCGVQPLSLYDRILGRGSVTGG
ncbi:MAG: hypothetical protein AAGC92_03985 [Pseudomonadota bacterium]